ncbi:MAG: Dihydropteroate synthase [Crocinitomicaceae bacterium]|nr:MAG: Dihydropteroate synthase [Crocinitomicaceae bacterium]
MKDTYLLDNYSINFKGNLISLSRPVVMSILNTTPDSFFDGGKYNSIEKALKKVEKDLNQGATIIDIGGYSTKPGGNKVTIDEEIRRTIPYIEKIVDTFPDINISIDTFRGKVAALALDAGAGMINDVSAWNMDKEMFETIKKYNVPYVLMHMKGEPKNMQDNPRYENVTKEVIKFLSEKLNMLNSNGISDVIIDPGFGFGKTNADNYKLLKNIEFLKVFKAPILVGISRKSMIYKTLKINKLDSINGTTALNMFALSKGAKILRVHDVKQAMECIYLNEEINCN